MTTARTVRSAAWNAGAGPWSVALEEDVLLADPAGWAPTRLPGETLATLASASHPGPGAHPSLPCHATG